MSTSKLQRETSRALSEHFGGFTIRENTRPEWLRGSHGTRLELDFLIEELNIAVEVQGCQHYAFTPHFHSNMDGYMAALKRDRLKRAACVKYGVLLFEISESRELPSLIKRIDIHTPESEFERNMKQPLADLKKNWKDYRRARNARRAHRRIMKEMMDGCRNRIHKALLAGNSENLQREQETLRKRCEKFGFVYDFEYADIVAAANQA